MEKDDEVKGVGNSIDFGARMLDPRLGRWLSVDPLFAKYPYESNFSAFANNPLLYIDFDGREIIIFLADGTTITYKAGMKPPNDKFAKKVVESLNSIHTTAEGANVLSVLIDSPNKFNIQNVPKISAETYKEREEGHFTEFALGKHGEKDKAFFDLLEKKEYSKAEKLLNETTELFVGVYGGANFDLAWKSIPNHDNVESNFTLALGHELFHAYQFETGRKNGNFIGGFNLNINKEPPLSEKQAVGFENYLRATLFSNTKYENPRYLYSGKTIPEYKENKEGLWKFLFGTDPIDVNEYKEGGKLYKVWRVDMEIQKHKKGQERLKKDKNNG